jgi:hypothetical protein
VEISEEIQLDPFFATNYPTWENDFHSAEALYVRDEIEQYEEMLSSIRSSIEKARELANELGSTEGLKVNTVQAVLKVGRLRTFKSQAPKALPEAYILDEDEIGSAEDVKVHILLPGQVPVDGVQAVDQDWEDGAQDLKPMSPLFEDDSLFSASKSKLEPQPSVLQEVHSQKYTARFRFLRAHSRKSKIDLRNLLRCRRNIVWWKKPMQSSGNSMLLLKLP